ncbi:RNA polymerase sigma factor SigE [Georgenia faecalis]|uniref:RNA polymerase sigma factor SigE n=1 Tax=Georgenia faecalis TaxID=2483799 RepID=A0ABV9D884_9MICO|nr:RNA polymerase sigma factor SigE [Georgenia faecalis]
MTTDPSHDGAWVPPSWEDVVREHSGRVYRLAYRLTGNRADAEDLTQETFVRVFRSLSRYEPGSFEGWLHRITTNLFLDQARKRSRARLTHLGDLAEQLPAPFEQHDLHRRFEHDHLDPDIQAALDALPPRYRAAVVLCDIEGLSYEEIGRTLGVKMGTVRSRIHRGRAMLRDALPHLRPAVRGRGDLTPHDAGAHELAPSDVGAHDLAPHELAPPAEVPGALTRGRP